MRSIPTPDLAGYVLVRKSDLDALLREAAMTARLATIAEATAPQRYVAPLLPYIGALALLNMARSAPPTPSEEG